MMKKKILAFLTAVICFAGVMPVDAAAEDTDKGVKGLQEAGGSSLISGEQSVGIYVDYYSKLSEISENAKADTAKLIIDESYSSDTVSSSCTIKSLGRDLTIDAGNNDIIVLLDEAVLEKTVTVKADKGSVTFFIQGSLICGKESKGIVWHDICDGCIITYDKYIPICFYGSEDSVITLNDEAILCGSLRLPYTVLDNRSSGAFKIEYVSENDNKTSSMKPSIIGNVLLKKLMNDEKTAFAFCSGKAETGDVYSEPEYKIVKLPDKVEYKIGEMIDLKGLEIEVTRDNEEPVVYTYPDIAFAHDSNTPKAPTVILFSDFRSNKAGTYKVEVADANNVSFEVKVIDDSILTDESATIPEKMNAETGTDVATSASDVKFDEDEFYVVVGNYGGFTQLRYLTRRSDGSYAAEKIVWEAAPQGLSYGDVLTAEGKVIMEEVKSTSNPAYAMAYYYKLDDSTKLTKVGSCSQLMEKKDLTVERAIYDGSAHWSIYYTDENGEEYYYGLSTFGSSLGVNPTSGQKGDIYTFAAIDGNIVVPLSKKDSKSNVNKEPEYRIVKLPDKVEYNIGEMIDLKGLEIEVTKSNEEPVVYTYPDIAFAHDSNTPKPPTVILISNFRSNKAGTYKVEVADANDVSFEVKVVDDSTIKDLGVFEEGETMTLDDVIELSKKGSDLTVKDFIKFKGVIAGSGIFILEYDLGNGYTLTVGSAELYKIDYARLRYSGSENYIDIRTDDVEKYLSASAEVSIIKGDSNCDGSVDMADAVLIMQALANPNKYGIDGTAEHHLTEQGKLNGDMNGDGLTVGDAQAIQRKLLGLDDHAEVTFDKTVDWYISDTAESFWDICLGGEYSAVITNTDELKVYLSKVLQEKAVKAYVEKYNDSFFKDNTLLLDSIYQSAGMKVGYKIDNVDFSDDKISISVIYTFGKGQALECVVSLCIAQVTVPKDAYDGQTVNWTIEKPYV